MMYQTVFFTALFTYLPTIGVMAEKPAHSQPIIQEKVALYSGRSMNLIVPGCPLAAGSVQILPKDPEMKDFSGWQVDNKREAYHLLQRIAGVWKDKGISDYLIYGKESSEPNQVFSWEIVPYPKEGMRFAKQFNVLWNTIFGASCLSKDAQEQRLDEFQKDKAAFESVKIEPGMASVLGNDVFCNPAVIDRQRVFEGKEINVLYNYAPVVMGADKLHFLIIPKQHRPGFSDLTESEYLEAMEIVQKLIAHYQVKGYPIVYIYDKTGAEAGQTVPHWHEHVVFAETKTQEFLAKLKVLKNMVFGGSPISNEELEMRVKSLKNELVDVL